MPNSKDQAQSLFLNALEIPTAVERAAYVMAQCGEDRELRKEVEELLDHARRLGPFLEPNGNGVDGTVAHPMSERPGTVIGPYKLLQQIGEGGMGVVFMAEQAEPIQRTVALKIIKPGMDTRQVIARFEAERQAVAMMDHPNIAKVLDAGTTDSGRPYFVMELVKGVPITKYCDEKHLPLRERLELFMQVCHAVQHAHQKGIIHRDIKPNNVLVAEYDNHAVPKVIDFGVAKATAQRLTDRTMFTEFGQVLGTMEYMSPEQAKLNQLDIDTRSDIYSLGVLLYELLVGSTPFEGKRLHEAALDEMLRIIREEDPPKPSTRLSSSETLPSIAANRHIEPARLSKDVRGELDWIVMKALEKDRNRRYETANRFAADIERHLRDEPVEAGPPSAAYRFRKFARRNKPGLTMGAIVALAVLVGVASMGWAVRDRVARSAVLEHAVAQALDETASFYQSTRLSDALGSLQQAEGLLASVGESHNLRERVRQWRADLTMVTKLEETRLELSQLDNQAFDTAAADQAYRVAFRQYGVDVEALDAADAAGRIRTSVIKDDLVIALDDWVFAKWWSGRPGVEDLTAIVRQVDFDPWRSRFRDAFQRRDRNALQNLAVDKEALSQPRATLLFLASALHSLDNDALAIDVLRQAQQRYPNDFWLNVTLGSYLMSLDPPRVSDAMSFYRAAAALRPESPSVHMKLGIGLHKLGRRSESEAEYRDAIRLKPVYATARYYLDVVLRAQGKPPEATTQPPPEKLLVELQNAARKNERGATKQALSQSPIPYPASRAVENPANGHYYQRLDVLALSWHDAKDLCESMDGYLATITSPDENEFIYQNFADHHAVWLGGTDEPEEGRWQWITGEPFQYQDWAIGQPDNSNKKEHFLGMGSPPSVARDGLIQNFSPAPRWNDFPSSGDFFGVPILVPLCEWDTLKAMHRNSNKRYAPAFLDLGQALLKQGNIKDAETAFREAFWAVGRDPTLLNSLAWRLDIIPNSSRQLRSLSLQAAQKAVDRQPRDPNYWNTLGVAHYRAGDWKNALAALQKSVEIGKGGNCSDWFFLAMTHWQLGDKDEAHKWFDQAVASMEKNEAGNEQLRGFRTEAEQLLKTTNKKPATKPAVEVK